MNDRKEYIDIAKGIVILWVVWMHIGIHSLLYASVQMPFFFFVSGSLWKYKNEKFGRFIRKKSRSFIIPTIFFALSTAIIFYLRGNVDFMQMNILDKMDASIKGSITWFLIAIFIFNIIQYYVEKFNLKKIELSLSIILYPIGAYLYAKGFYSIMPIIPIAHILVFWIYYVIGTYMGNGIIHCIEKDYKRAKFFAYIGAVIILLVHIIPWNYGVLSHISFYIYIFPYTLSFIFLILYVCKRLEKIYALKFFNYVGYNSIIIYLVHWPLWIQFMKKPLSNVNMYISYLLIIPILLLSIVIINKYIPFIIGKDYKK